MPRLRYWPSNTRAAVDEQVEFGAGVGAPEVHTFLGEIEKGQQLFEDEPLPGSTALRVPLERCGVLESKQSVEQARVAHLDLGHLDLPLAEVGVPRLQLADHEGFGERVGGRC